MKCPACSKELQKQTVDNIELDVCTNGCSGVWFDNHEFKKFDELKETRGAFLISLFPKDIPAAKHSNQFKCPKCVNIVMMRRFSSALKTVEIDECGSCGSIWLDANELEKIRAEFPTEAARKNAAASLADSMFSRQMSKERQTSTARSQSTGFMRYLSPSYWFKSK